MTQHASRKWFLLAGILMLSSAAMAAAPRTGDIGLGLNLGDTIGGTAKYWLDRYSALDLTFGSASDGGNFAIYGDYLYHGWKAFPQPKSGTVAAYLGAGPRIKTTGGATEVGVRGVVGASFWTPQYPLEIYAELGPLIRFSPNGGADVVGGVGLRYYFRSWN